jgi:hypothetical protein
MRNELNCIAAFAAGAAAMYYLDSRMGARRRALVTDKVIAAGHETAEFLQAKGKRAADRAKGVLATGRLDRVSTSEPQSDAQLCERVRARLGHIVAQPKAVEVEAQQGSVKLTGHVLAREVDKLLAEVSGMAGVRKVDNALATHQNASEITDLMSRRQPAGQPTAPLL